MNRIITTGGTIDKIYNPLQGQLTVTESFVPAMLRQANFTNPYVLQELMRLDSLDMTDADRTLIAETCTEAPEQHIVITHGTDTMPETARHIKEQLGRDIGLRTIVLTGAMVPFGLKNSDALFNLGYAIGQSEQLSPGVYVAMNGRVFLADEVMKDREQGIFVQRPLSNSPYS